MIFVLFYGVQNVQICTFAPGPYKLAGTPSTVNIFFVTQQLKIHNEMPATFADRLSDITQQTGLALPLSLNTKIMH